ncbi:MAG: DsbA family protein [Pseudomonadota bacterium]
MPTLFHFHDPMCSWCWAFKPTWETIAATLPASVSVRRVLGGLAPDTDAVMPAAMQETIAGYWRHIESAVPGTRFNHDFWHTNTPRRATYPACRAVAATRMLSPEYEEAMVTRIQHAYYLEARNPSDDDTLVDLAGELALDTSAFAAALHADETLSAFSEDLNTCARFGVQGFPSLVLRTTQGAWRIRIDYTDASVSLGDIAQALAS